MSAVTVEIKKILEGAGLFTVEIATTPAKGQDMSGFKPKFSTYDLVVVNYDGTRGRLRPGRPLPITFGTAAGWWSFTPLITPSAIGRSSTK